MKAKNRLIQSLCPYGNLPHSKGMQIVNKISAEKMLKNSPSTFMKKIFGSIPIYVGHPDESEKKSNLKNEIVGYIENIIPLDDGIAIIAVYDDVHYKKILNNELRALSPRWKMRELENGSYMPIKLISAGLTNEPNISNSGEILSPSKLLGYKKFLNEKISETKNNSYKIKEIFSLCEKSICNANSIKKSQDFLKESIAKKLITTALNNGAISANDCSKWNEDFKDKFQETKQKLIKTNTQKNHLNTSDLIELTKSKMQEKNISWDNAFSEVKREKLI